MGSEPGGSGPEGSEIVLIGSGITVLGTARCLGRLGRRPVVLSESPDLEQYSKYYRRFPGPLLSRINRAAINQALSGPEWNGSVVIPCSDHAVRATAQSIEAGANYKAVVPTTALLEQLTDKAGFARLLDQYSVPHPLTMFVEPGQPVPKVPAGARNYFLKPRDSQAFFRKYGVKGLKLEAGVDPQSKIEEIRSSGLEVVIQQYIPGGPENHIYVEGYFSKFGELKALFARRRLRMYPPDYGNSTAMESIALSEVQQAADDLVLLLKKTGYRGIFSAEFKYDAEDRLFKLIEINPRAWWYIHFLEKCGLNLPEINRLDAQDQPVPESFKYRVGLRSIYGYYDLHALAGERGGMLRGVLSIPGAWSGSSFLVFALDDPRPAVMTCFKQISASLKSRLRR
jgi:D-aspartate ligase